MGKKNREKRRMKEYIVSIADDDSDFDAMFIGGIRKVYPELIRCKDCKYHHYDHDIPYCSIKDYGYGWKDEDFCSRAERKEE